MLVCTAMPLHLFGSSGAALHSSCSAAHGPGSLNPKGVGSQMTLQQCVLLCNALLRILHGCAMVYQCQLLLVLQTPNACVLANDRLHTQIASNVTAYLCKSPTARAVWKLVALGM